MSEVAAHAYTTPWVHTLHAVHADAPGTAVKLTPLVHAVHTVDVLAATLLPYVPAAHNVHELVPISALYEPAKQAVQAEVPVDRALYPPAPQAVHTDEVDAEVTLPYVPEPHAEHVLAPVVSALYAPAKQEVQASDVAADTMLPWSCCYSGWHPTCLQPQLDAVPEGECLCAACEGATAVNCGSAHTSSSAPIRITVADQPISWVPVFKYLGSQFSTGGSFAAEISNRTRQAMTAFDFCTDRCGGTVAFS